MFLTVILCLILALVFILGLVKLIWYFTSGSYKINPKDVKGKTFVVTGATSGIGMETVRILAQNGGKVKMLVRNVAKAKNVITELTEDWLKQLDLEIIECDTSSLASVRKAAEEVLQKCPKIDVLMNNAGIGSGDGQYYKSEDGYNLIVATNHIGHVLLTELLMDRLKESAPARIVNVSSLAFKLVNNKGPKYSADTLDLPEEHHDGLKTYSFSKLAQIHVTRVMARLLHGTGVTVNVLHPGVVKTNISPDRFITAMLSFFKSSESGAQTQLYLSVAPELENVSGHYFADCAFSSLTLLALNDKVADEIYEKSLEMAKIDHVKKD